MDAGTFYMWLANHFISNIPATRPVVLLVDSADAHIDLQMFELAKENQVHIFTLLKNATHLVQPADVGLFGAMKQTWYKHVRRFSQKHPGTDITKKNFCSVFKSTWDDVMHPSTLKVAFRKSSIYPIVDIRLPMTKLDHPWYICTVTKVRFLLTLPVNLPCLNRRVLPL